ncbi:hypothetical protein HanRHA438_Chr03g0146221 [Helianthus annuus]|uniref:Late embryogenesis abundant (LEA) hydroxyproline-rich glycoprotein family n=2 Tax=Helianthus annuus TaxID=4232 RepID=A0A251VB54_HELAN|nr:hypothetical protein HanXRQr2_Chr03g0134631 [Helianthus annuus]KAJ0594711.1 putative protein NDR1 [Helianthus annuus]KAJ0603001.1 hypothetical protein HanIR_Chr03g0145811 [Helianthus annuus]KAJ0609770.1 putative protein NDR1 [Helianthus annuus]KAJ0769832.1 putative protein NDR1 [Helianthus annuus]
MSVEDDVCNHDKRQKNHRVLKSISLVTLITLCVILTSPVLILVFFLTLTPYPHFTLHDVKLTTFNFSTTLTSNLQITISCRNYDDPFHFEKIDVYASYRNQQITLPTMLPPMYLKDFTVWSLSLNGTEVSVPPYLAAYLVQDVTVGNVLINVEVTGRLRAKSGFLSRRFRLKVNCPEYIMFGNDTDVIGSATKRPFVEWCHVGVTPLKSVMQILTSAFDNLVGI